ncbi:hypothetical protein SDC9_87823 [bioreactor metagenome]|uniref:Uncharacterized protein n=1 Tax=bioreactor metagenome TaxID=1076179 RepID=A0A644ZRA3_9ZZZZ
MVADQNQRHEQRSHNRDSDQHRHGDGSAEQQHLHQVGAVRPRPGSLAEANAQRGENRCHQSAAENPNLERKERARERAEIVFDQFA